jgi:hypothetical protein
MWTDDEVAELIQETRQGSLRWRRSGDGAMRADRGDGGLTLRRAEDGGVTLTKVDVDDIAVEDAMQVTVVASSMPPPTAAFAALWEAAQDSTA